MLIRRRWHITWTSTDSDSTKSLSFSVRTAVLLLVLAIAFALALGASGMWLLLHRVSDTDMTALSEENTLLREKLDDMTAQVDSVHAQIELMQDWENRVRRDDNLRRIEEVYAEEAASGYVPGYEPPVDEEDETETKSE